MLQVTIRRTLVDTWAGEFISIFERLDAAVLGESGHEQHSVIVVGDSATIVDVTSYENQCFPWHFVLLQEQSEHREGRLKIGIIEGIALIPTEWPELSSFLNDGVIERKREQKLPPNFRFACLFQDFLSHWDVASLDVGLHTSWWFDCKFWGIL